MNSRHLIRLVFPVLALFAMACNGSRTSADFFDADTSRSRTRALIDAQAAKGAATDASLSDAHFDGVTLNALGQQKLDLMLKADFTAGNRQVFVKPSPRIDADRIAFDQARVASVQSYLTARGLVIENDMVSLGESPESGRAVDNVVAVRLLRQPEPFDAGASTSTDSITLEPTENAY